MIVATAPYSADVAFTVRSTATSRCVVSAPSVACSRNTYAPATVPVTVVRSAFGSEKMTPAPAGADTVDQWYVSVPVSGMPSSVAVPTRVVDRLPSREWSTVAVTTGASLTTTGTSRPESKTWISEIAVENVGVFVNATRTLLAVTVSKSASLNFGPGIFGALKASGTVTHWPAPFCTWIE
ncbi:hypothetical protein D3C86_1720230 [compost metagenome]